MASVRSPGIASRALFIPALALGLLLICSSLLGYALFHYRILYQDGWAFYQRLIELPLWQGLWVTHNGHWLVIPGLLTRANMALFNGNLTNLIIVSLIAQIVSASMLIRMGTRTLGYRLNR